MEYLIGIAVFEGREHVRQDQIITSAVRKELNDWLREARLPTLSSWRRAAYTGSGAPRGREVLNTLHLEHGPHTLLVTCNEIVPVSPDELDI